ncbi:MAG: alpha-mannosyltransferase [Ponticaulis sp.]|nr:alpha-mannosyltransferase [Ponticaulis sp.]|tara:strand:+ start:43027 stop:44121 length:1095 start_codon:yes stop_codon:yes gene_type:complete
MKIMLITDAWHPQVNGVVRTLNRVIEECEAMGHEFEIVSPNDGFKTVPLPTYSEIQLAIGARKQIEERFHEFEPEAVHIATEGTLGMAGRSMCLKNKMPFTTSYHTRFPEYVSARVPVPLSWGYSFMKWFHRYSGHIMVATASMREELESRGFGNVVAWSRGVDTELFHPDKRTTMPDPYEGMERPIFLNVGRVAVEKNIEAFVELDLPGTRVVVGDGPQREELEKKYPHVKFLGAKFGDELAACFAHSDVFVFPSLTDTFGLVILEAMATGTPVAGYEVPGPKDLIPGSNAGAISDDLKAAAMECLDIDRATCRTYAEGYSWTACAETFVTNLEPLPVPERRRFWKRLRRLRRREQRDQESVL